MTLNDIYKCLYDNKDQIRKGMASIGREVRNMQRLKERNLFIR